MFSALRANSLFYILEKGADKPTLKVGQVVSVSNPAPKYSTQFQPTQFGNLDTTVDIQVKVGEETMDFKQLPSTLSIVNFGNNGVVVSESREAMTSEVEAMLRNSQQILDSMCYHQNVVTECDGILRQLNPQFAKEKAQEEKISALEDQVGAINNTLGEMMGMLRNALGTTKESAKKA